MIFQFENGSAWPHSIPSENEQSVFSATDYLSTRLNRPLAIRLLDEAEVRGERLDFVRTEVTRDHRHRGPCARMISLAPLFEAALQVEIGQSAQTRNISHALGIRTMAGIT